MPPTTPLADLAAAYGRLANELRTLAEQVPGAHVVRNPVGNLAVMSPGGRYLGWIDVLTGEVEAQ